MSAAAVAESSGAGAGTRALENARTQESIDRNREAAGIRRSASIKQAGNERQSAWGLVALAFHALALQLAEAAHSFGALACLLLRWLLEMPAELHLAEYALALHLLLERPEGLVDV